MVCEYRNEGTSLLTSVAQGHSHRLYSQVSNTLSNAIGDALEVATFQALRAARTKSRRYQFDGHFFLNRPKRDGRFLRGQTTNDYR